MPAWKALLLAAGIGLALAACTPVVAPLAPTLAAPTSTAAIATPVLAATNAANLSTAALATPTAVASTAVPATGATAPAASAQPSPAALSDIARTAQGEAARLLTTREDQIIVLGVERVEWPSPALGCPLPGLQYNSEATRPGYSVKLEVGGLLYEYNTDDTGRAVLCDPDGQPVIPGLKITPGTIDDGEPWQPVN